MPKKRIRWKRWMYTLFHRRVMVFLLLLVQLLIFFYMLVSGIAMFRGLYFFFMLLSVISLLFIITRRKEIAYKLPWVMLIALMPAFGGLLFFLIHGQSSTKRFERRREKVPKGVT